MKLYGMAQSMCTRRVLFAFAEKGQDPNLTLVNLSVGEHRTPEHLARHPFGKVPVLEDAGFFLYESHAIVRYLDSKLPGASMTPTDPKARAVMDQWMSAQICYLSPHVSTLLYQFVLGPMMGAQTDMAAVGKAREALTASLDVLDRSLEGKKFLAGETLSLADVVVAPDLQFLQQAKQDDLLSSRKYLTAYWERVASRPTWQKVLGYT